MKSTSNTKIIIADDHALFINGLQLLLKEENWIEISDTANDGRELLDILNKSQPDLILLDLNMPLINGFEASRHIKQNYPAVKLIILSTYNEEHLIEKAKKIGINGYLLKNCSREDLLQAIKMVMSNQTSFPYFEPEVNTSFNDEDIFLKQFNLTKRELEIVQLIKNEFTNQQIADRLFLSIYTIETHRKNVMSKLNLKTPAALIKFILENRL
jgi:two-component system, NarL family, nitrate/nitrite response regulator NarL